MDLREFIEARLAEDESIARAAAPFGRRPMVLHDPARVLRQAESARRLLALHPHVRYEDPLDAASSHEEDHRPAFDDAPRYVGCTRCHYDPRYEESYPSWWCETVRLLALPYSDHPDYRQEWTP